MEEFLSRKTVSIQLLKLLHVFQGPLPWSQQLSIRPHHEVHTHPITIYIFFIEGPRSRCYGHTAALRLIVQPCDEDYVFSAFPLYWSTGGMKLTGENRSTRRKYCLSATLFTTNPTWTDPGSNPSLRGERPATNRLSHDTAMMYCDKPVKVKWRNLIVAVASCSCRRQYTCVHVHYCCSEGRRCYELSAGPGTSTLKSAMPTEA
jgi:hypothetical protein